MTRDVVRILALGRGETLDRAASGLTALGYAVAQVNDRKRALRLLKDGDFDLVLADGESKDFAELAAEAGGARPWLLLGHAEGIATPGNAVRLAAPVAADALAEQVQALVAEGRKAAAKTAGQKSVGQKASARAAGASRPPT